MRSRIVAALASGALLLTLVPAALAVDNPYCTTSSFDGPTVDGCTTAVTLAVGSGTAIIVPVAFSLGSGLPGEVVESSAQTVTWMSNEDTMAITVSLTDLAFGSYSIDKEDVYYDDGGSQRFFTGTPLWVKDIVTSVGDNDIDHQDFLLGLQIPGQKPDGTYAGTLTFGIGAQP